MAKGQKFHVEAYIGKSGWWPLIGSEGTRQYCEGFVNAMDSIYPSRPCRIIRTNPNGSIDVVRETKGRSTPGVS